MTKYFALLILSMVVTSARVVAVEPDPQDILQLEQEALRAAGDFAQRSVVQIETFGGREIVGDSAVAAGPSSGTVIAAEGWIITSLFQFRGDPASITVLLPDGQRKSAKLVARDHARELALLKIDIDEPLVPAVLSPRSSWQIGQWTIAIGKTFDIVTASRSIGILSATDRIFGRAIQTDCKVSPHNYGGPLLDIQGRTMGVLAPIDPGIATEGEVQQWYDAGVGFAIPLDDILKRLPRLMKGEDVYPGKAGIRPALKDDFRGPVVLAGVAPGTPAAKAGLKAGDTLLKIDGTEIRWPNHMRHAFGSVDAGDSVKMTVKRGEETKSFDCQLVQELPVYRTPYLGILPDPSFDGPGVKIRAVAKDGPASKASIMIGQVIRQIGDEAVDSIEDLERKLAFLDYREPASFSVSRASSHLSPRGALQSDKDAKEIRDDKDVNKATAAALDEDLERISVQLSPWPNEISRESAREASPLEAPPEAQEKPSTGVVSLVMGDVKNQAFAFVPPTYHPSTAHGLLLVVPEPGKVERKTWVDRWELFCRDHRFILTVVSSSDPEAWSMEELEIIRRSVQQVRSDYKIDPRRMVVGGVGAGSTPAVVLALQNRDTFRGLWLAGGNIPRGLRMPQVEPMESIAILLQGDNPAYAPFASKIEELGYRAIVSSEKFDLSAPVTGNAIEQQAQSFFASLEWL